MTSFGVTSIYRHLWFLLVRHSVVSNSLQPPELQHTMLPCPSLSSRVCPNSHPLNRWCHPTSSFSVIPFSWLKSFPASWSFLMSCLITSGDESTGALVSASILPMNNQGWFHLGFVGLISLLSNGLSKVFVSTTVQKHQFFSTQPSLRSSSHNRTWLMEKPELWLYRPLSVK